MAEAKEVRVSKNRMIAYVAIRRERGGGAMFAYLPSTTIPLPQGWEWCYFEREVSTEDVTEIGRGMSLDETCRMMCTGTGITWTKDGGGK